MSERDAQVNIKLAKDTLEKWDRYIEEESDFTTRSEFVRFAVNREVSQQHEAGEASGANQALLEEIRDSVVGLSDRMDSMENQVDTLQSAVRSDPDVEELANELFGLLPDEKPGTPEWREERENLQTQAQAEGDDVTMKEARAWEGTPESLAQAFDVPERKIHSAIDLLIAETHLIRTEETGDGETRYWTEV
ncbi:ribbon-helix-helix domain-containing protein [Halopenitus sp. H-Gu1]|uniref:ribbon-helix-helix domain-containing protein n=1 Tax=Halopenitus sp. H-Gu1 TaxID=3242697 RepID=UPI00359DC766